MSNKDYVTIPRKVRELSVYHDANCMPVYLHLLLTANAEDSEWQGLKVSEGELVTSDFCIAAELGLDVVKVRYAMSILEARGLISRNFSEPWSIVTLTDIENLI